MKIKKDNGTLLAILILLLTMIMLTSFVLGQKMYQNEMHLYKIQAQTLKLLQKQEADRQYLVDINFSVDVIKAKAYLDTKYIIKKIDQVAAKADILRVMIENDRKRDLEYQIKVAKTWTINNERLFKKVNGIHTDTWLLKQQLRYSTEEILKRQAWDNEQLIKNRKLDEIALESYYNRIKSQLMLQNDFRVDYFIEIRNLINEKHPSMQESMDEILGWFETEEE